MMGFEPAHNGNNFLLAATLPIYAYNKQFSKPHLTSEYATIMF